MKLQRDFSPRGASRGGRARGRGRDLLEIRALERADDARGANHVVRRRHPDSRGDRGDLRRVAPDGDARRARPLAVRVEAEAQRLASVGRVARERKPERGFREVEQVPDDGRVEHGRVERVPIPELGVEDDDVDKRAKARRVVGREHRRVRRRLGAHHRRVDGREGPVHAVRVSRLADLLALLRGALGRVEERPELVDAQAHARKRDPRPDAPRVEDAARGEFSEPFPRRVRGRRPRHDADARRSPRVDRRERVHRVGAAPLLLAAVVCPKPSGALTSAPRLDGAAASGDGTMACS
mmetsp:Transcript_28361/g.87745  ORF Transcript_28361/g.87745 Transcript_28361/m.87745 type:complete len:296 (-) Transcript_28361:54-941(-)